MFALFASKDKKSTFLKNKPMGDDKDKYFTYFFVVPIGLSFKNIEKIKTLGKADSGQKSAEP